jgi:hypothetical protein
MFINMYNFGGKLQAYLKNSDAKYFLARAAIPSWTTDETFDPEFSKEQDTSIILPGNGKQPCLLLFIFVSDHLTDIRSTFCL